MGSYRTPAAQAARQATLRAEDRPEGIAPEDWLGREEWIIYWTQMPYGAAADIAEAATVAIMDTGNRASRRSGSGGQSVRAEYRAGRAAVAMFIMGLVNWYLLDESGQVVPYVVPNLDEPDWFFKGKALMSALPGPVVDRLQKLIDAGSEPSLDAVPDDAEQATDTEGNDSGAI